jgi:hypothetical protein
MHIYSPDTTLAYAKTARVSIPTLFSFSTIRMSAAPPTELAERAAYGKLAFDRYMLVRTIPSPYMHEFCSYQNVQGSLGLFSTERIGPDAVERECQKMAAHGPHGSRYTSQTPAAEPRIFTSIPLLNELSLIGKSLSPLKVRVSTTRGCQYRSKSTAFSSLARPPQSALLLCISNHVFGCGHATNPVLLRLLKK